ncbi:MAG: hypothetical protein ABJ215_09670 [Alphaproteobacteria bacterium]
MGINVGVAGSRHRCGQPVAGVDSPIQMNLRSLAAADQHGRIQFAGKPREICVRTLRGDRTCRIGGAEAEDLEADRVASTVRIPVDVAALDKRCENPMCCTGVQTGYFRDVGQADRSGVGADGINDRCNALNGSVRTRFRTILTLRSCCLWLHG